MGQAGTSRPCPGHYKENPQAGKTEAGGRAGLEAPAVAKPHCPRNHPPCPQATPGRSSPPRQVATPQAGCHPPGGLSPPAIPSRIPRKGAARSQPAQPPAQASQPKYLQEALPSMGTAARHRVHMPQQCLIKLPNSTGIPLRLSEDKLGARLLSGNAGTGKEQSLFSF